MLSSWITRLCKTRLKRSKARTRLVVLFCLAVLLKLAHLAYTSHRNHLILKHSHQKHFELTEWLEDKVQACGDNFAAYGNQFVWLKDAQLNPTTNSFVIQCNTRIPSYWFDRRIEGTPYTKWLENLEVRLADQTDRHNASDITSGITFVLERIEAHNLYHTMCEIYNIFLLHKLFGLEFNKSNVLFMDSRPGSPMDELWTTLFDNVMHHEQVQESTRFKNIIWIPIGYESPLNRHKLESVPYLQEFRQYFISNFGINQIKATDCNSRNYTLILRHDYITHPERLTLYQGTVFRKFSKEDDIIQEIKNTIGTRNNLKTILLETLSMKEQVEVFTHTDVLVAAHGAGMTHLLFLPNHAYVIEIRPYLLDKLGAHHFSVMSRWRHLNYISLKSDNVTDDINVPKMKFSLDELSKQIRIIQCNLDHLCVPSNMPC